jgi:hypothetical protein
MRSIIRLFAIILVLGVLSRPHMAFGQGGATGALSGTAVDLSGGPVAETDVQIFYSATDLLVITRDC